LKVNGKTLTISEAVTLTQFLVKAGYEISKIAVEMNGKIIPKREYEIVQLHDDDALEIVTFVRGG
jgi:sulfur carrier protein